MAKKNKNANEVPVSTNNVNEVPMSEVKIKATKGSTTVLETIEVSPLQLVFSDEFRGRVKPVHAEVQIDLADSIRRNGQQQPIQVRKSATEEGKFEVIFGNTRGLAGLLIANGYKNGEGKEVKGDAKFTLRAEVVDVDDETAFVRNVVENAQRTQTSPMDNAFNQEKLRTQYGMSDAMITKHYGYAHQASVSRLKKLLTLEPEYQDSVHNGSLSQAAAFLLADVPAGESRTAVWLKAVDASKGEESIGASAMGTAIKQWKKEQKEAEAPAAAPTGEGETAPAAAPTGEAEAPAAAPTGEGETAPAAAPTKSLSLTLKQFKDLAKEVAADAKCPVVVAAAMGVILDCIEGKTEPAAFAQWFAANLIGGDIAPEVKEELSAEDSFDPAKNPRVEG